MKPLLSNLALITFFLSSCSASDTILVTVQNPSDFIRKEVVSVQHDDLKPLLNNRKESGILIRKKNHKEYVVTQWIDYNRDGQPDELLFQAEVGPNGTVAYEILWVDDAFNKQPKSEVTTYSRFVPERTDDYTWENDKVAFRTYGPEAQRLVEANEPGGTLSSGIDLWFKKVSYSIIDEWYKQNLKKAGYYHVDHGEGYDPYHVGKSRGTGGLGVWLSDSLLVSKNFTQYRTLATGPLRTVFELDYEPWSDYNIQETKRISLDIGSNFSKFEVSLHSSGQVPNYTIGITRHNKKGQITLDAAKGTFSHWEEIDSSFVGEGIVIHPLVIKDAFSYESKVPDQSQILIVTDPVQSKIIYYAGFAWTRSGQISNKEDWNALLKLQAERVQNPLLVKTGL